MQSDIKKFLSFWWGCARHAAKGNSAFANDWQWLWGIPLFSAFAPYLSSSFQVPILNTGHPITDGLMAALGAFIGTWMIAFIVRLFNAPVTLHYANAAALLPNVSDSKRITELQFQLSVALSALEKNKKLKYGFAFDIADRLRNSGLPKHELPFVISAPSESQSIKADLWTIIRHGLPNANSLGFPPDDLDVPKLPDSGKNGIVIHGESAFSEALCQALNGYSAVYKTTSFVNELNAYYKKFYKQDITWIEIGRGPLWKTDYIE